VWGITYNRERGIKPIESWEALRQARNDPSVILWADFEAPTPAMLVKLDALIDLDDEALEDCLGGEPHPRVTEYADYLLLVVYGVIVPPGEVEISARRLAIFRGERFLITIHTEPSRSVAALKERLLKAADVAGVHGIDQWLYRLVDGMTDHYFLLIDKYEEEVEDFEERSLDGQGHRTFLGDASHIRRQLIEIRRLAAAQRSLLEPLAEGEFDYVAADLSSSFRRVVDHLSHALDRIDGLRDRLNAAVQNYNSAIAKRTNDIMRTLTVLTAIMLPLSLVAGLYGMNVPLPASGGRGSFWGVVAIMVLLAAGMLALFRRWKWI
jgi:magnesium transporter